MTTHPVAIGMMRIEVAHLRRLTSEFAHLVRTATGADPVRIRLTPTAYPDDDEAGADFAAVTREDILARRATDAEVVLRDCASVPPEGDPQTPVQVIIPAESVEAWLRTFAAMRIILAGRLGERYFAKSHEQPSDEPSEALYEWLGYRLEGLVLAAERDENPTSSMRG